MADVVVSIAAATLNEEDYVDRCMLTSLSRRTGRVVYVAEATRQIVQERLK
jgi:hypothetical protein